jgi:hypothetical protein
VRRRHETLATRRESQDADFPWLRRETTSLSLEPRPLPPWRLGISARFWRESDLLLRLWIKARARLPLLLYEFPKTGHDEFAGLFSPFVCEVAERLEEYACGLFIGLEPVTLEIILRESPDKLHKVVVVLRLIDYKRCIGV